MKNYKRVIIFILLLLVIIYTIQYGLTTLYKKRAHQKFTEILNHTLDKQIMIFGSSVAYHHFDPFIIGRKTNLSVYNMGWDGVFFVQYNGLIKEYLSYEKECKYIVIACDFDNLDKNDLITRPDLMYAYINNPNIYASLHDIEPKKIALAKYVPGYRLTLFNKSFYKDIFFTGSDNDNNTLGYDPVNTDSFQVRTDKTYYARYNKKIYQEFKDCIDAITAKGIKVILVMTPVYENGYGLIQNADEIKNRYKALVNQNVFFFDYTTVPMCRSKNCFYNYSHLNAKGASIFSDVFSNDLLSLIEKH
jgi:hypothetical protein